MIFDCAFFLWKWMTFHLYHVIPPTWPFQCGKWWSSMGPFGAIWGTRFSDKAINPFLVGGIPTPLKNISQLGWLFPIYGKIKNVPNHQPDLRIVSMFFLKKTICGKIWLVWTTCRHVLFVFNWGKYGQMSYFFTSPNKKFDIISNSNIHVFRCY